MRTKDRGCVRRVARDAPDGKRARCLVEESRGTASGAAGLLVLMLLAATPESRAGLPPPSVELLKDVDDGGGSTVFQPGDTVRYSVFVINGSSSSEGLVDAVFTDILPPGVTPSSSNFTVDYGSGPVSLTIGADVDEGEIVGGIVTVVLGGVPVDTLFEVDYEVVLDPTESSGSLANTATLEYQGETSGGSFSTDSNTVEADFVACQEASACDDGFACTADTCDETGSCAHAPQDLLCDDSDAETLDSCVPGDAGADENGCTNVVGIFFDGFESGDTSEWSVAVSPEP